MRATALDERPYLSRQAASRVSSNPLPSPAWVGLYEDHAPLEAFSAQLALAAGLDATVPSGCHAVATPGGNVDLTTADRRCADCLLSRWLCSRAPVNPRPRARGSACSYR